MACAEQVNRQRLDDLVNDLRHQALHIIWQHPLRYAQERDRSLVNVACDVAVNQYLTTPPAGTMTLARLEQILHQPLPVQADSQTYLQILRNLDQRQQTRLATELKKSQASTQHQGWYQNGNQLIRQGNLKQVVRQSIHHLTARQRGTLPQAVREILMPTSQHYRLPFRQAFWRLVGQVPSGYQESRARFNRRQPQRLELPGRVTRLVTRLTVFVDQSGSMSNDTLSKVVGMLNELAKQADIEMQVGDFDAQVQTPPKPVNHLAAFERHGGGGTSYQAVFDYLADHNFSRQTPVIIVTDGWGEHKIDDHGYHRVLWLLTSQDHLSVQQPVGQVIRLEEDEWNYYHHKNCKWCWISRQNIARHGSFYGSTLMKTQTDCTTNQ